MTTVPERIYSTLVEDEEEHGCRELPDSACRAVPENAGRLVAGFTLQKLGDRIVDPKTVLAWLVTSLGAPGFTVALLVPIRESGSLLPQAAMIPLVRRFEYRKRAWVLGSIGQGLAVIGIGVAGAFLTGMAAGVTVLLALAGFALARAISSVSSKDLIGKTIPRGNRGSVTGISAAVAGFVAIGAGVALGVGAEGAEPVVLAFLVGGASLLWFGAGGVFLSLDEHASSGEEFDPGASIGESLALLRDDGHSGPSSSPAV